MKTALSCESSLCAVRHLFVLIYCSVQNICIGCEGSNQRARLWHVLHVAYLEENCCLVFIHQSCLYLQHCFVLVYEVNSTFITLSPSLFAPYLCILIKLLFYLLFRARQEGSERIFCFYQVLKHFILCVYVTNVAPLCKMKCTLATRDGLASSETLLLALLLFSYADARTCYL